jgi:hypothetical protein
MRHYIPPGPPDDPWGPYIRTASSRFAVPDIWIRAVMRQESGGDRNASGALAVSPVGAIGLMQVMPDTYALLRDRYGLGDDPYNPRDNILAGAAYIREMYNLFGFPAFLAAYNAGPDYVNACLSTGAPLPQETVSYLSSVAPRLRPYITPSGPLAPYADIDGAPADELNRRALLGQPMPVATSAPQPLPCLPPASDHFADDLNRAELAAQTGAGGGSIADLLNRQRFEAPPPS